MADSPSALSILNGGNNRMGGLMSGLDTESLVKASAARTKIALNTKKQKLQTLQWKQEAYRDVTKKLTDFRDKFLNIVSSDSIKANATMNKYTATSTNDKLLVSAVGGAAQTDYTITETQAAQAAEVKGENVLSGGIKLDFSRASAGINSVNVTIDGTTREVTFTKGSSAEETQANFLEKLNKTASTFSSAQFEMKNGELVVKNPEGDNVKHSFKVSSESNTLGADKTGFSNQIDTSAKLKDINFAKELQSDGGKFEFSINGSKFSFDENTTVKEMMETINKSDAGVTMSFSSLSQSFSLKTNLTGAGQTIELSQNKGNLLNSMFGVSEESLSTSAYMSRAYDDSAMSTAVSDKAALSFRLGDETITVHEASEGAGIKLEDILNMKDQSGNNIFSRNDTLGVYTLKGTGILTGNDDDATAVLNSMFDSDAVRGIDSEIYAARGKNARMTVDGVTLESATGKFTIDGTTFDVSKIKDFKADDENGVDPITVTTKHDTSAVKDVIKNFINEYNSLVKEMDELIKTKRPKDNGSYYDPLTEEQEEEMDDKQIEKWNEKAKTGLLYNDATLIGAMSSIKNAMTSTFNGMSLNDLGISMNKYSSGSTANVYEIDDTKLEAAIEKYGDDIAKFFTDPDKGLAHNLENAFDKAVSTKKNSAGYSIGSLTQLAGVKGTTSDTKNQMYNQMNSVQKMIDSLTKKYEKEQDRYWKRFTSLETYLSKMQAQSSAVFGGGAQY